MTDDEIKYVVSKCYEQIGPAMEAMQATINRLNAQVAQLETANKALQATREPTQTKQSDIDLEMFRMPR